MKFYQRWEVTDKCIKNVSILCSKTVDEFSLRGPYVEILGYVVGIFSSTSWSSMFIYYNGRKICSKRRVMLQLILHRVSIFVKKTDRFHGLCDSNKTYPVRCFVYKKILGIISRRFNYRYNPTVLRLVEVWNKQHNEEIKPHWWQPKVNLR